MSTSAPEDQLPQVQKVTGTTIVFVTHDVEEAGHLSDRAIVLTGRPANVDVPLM